MFDRKVSEADTYLQLMIDQTTKIEQRIEEIESPEEREKYDSLKEQANVSPKEISWFDLRFLTWINFSGNDRSH